MLQPCATCVQESRETLAFRMLDQVVMVELIKPTLEQYITPYMRANRLDQDNIFSTYVKVWTIPLLSQCSRCLRFCHCCIFLCFVSPRPVCFLFFSALDISDFVISVSFCVLRPVCFCFSALDVSDFAISMYLYLFCVPSDYTFFSFLVLETSHILSLLYLYLFCVHGAFLHFHFAQHFWTRSLTEWYFTSSDGSSLQTK